MHVDDATILAQSEQEFQVRTDIINKVCQDYNIKISNEK